ncbi:putative methionine transporter, NhaC family [Clostridium cadaveris]|uniref:Putative methionine transporter, NhaC family n=1 Tax=Clostridium cadaveris TaxID=1529 RepID=A0A1I2K7C5_9CLOT|nr:Na+/H+ antiporter NhaC family protein [Clostridium cadaveris]MDM8310903.1 Na+/H+ antiporter NhaC family protein [Clostridium cadaveris]MDU4950854.1 Na+/H+ antiporter NhaC family protein [Clostridium sp.]SFF62343.1 putative methionine transporter, NhaC family [Clostridium cadaveris]
MGIQEEEIINLNKSKGNIFALIPLGVFLLIYLAGSIIANDFYKIPVGVAFLVSAIAALAMNRKKAFEEKLETFCKGVGKVDIILMLLIFVLAGAFAQVAKDMGAVDSTVNLGLSILPANIMVVGIFIIACFISLSIGTSVGTIVALTPVAVSIAEKLGSPIGLVVAAVVGGAMFGDNLSMISDTTIAASRTQGSEMKDKFRCNFKLALLAAVISVVILFMLGGKGNALLDTEYTYNIIKIVPYILVLSGALLGGNVMVVLTFGTIVAGTIGIFTGSFDIWGFVSSVSTGMLNMGELIIITILVSGTVEVIKANGGIDFIINFIKSKINSKMGAKLGVAALVSIVDICTANNTVAIVMSGPIAKEVGDEYEIEPKKMASILDIFSCVFQGIIPYGAQLLMAAGIAGISSFEIMQFLFYPYILGVIALIAIIIKKF